MKVKEPLPEEYGYFYEGMVVFAYFHLANESELTKELIDKKVVAIAYETVQLENNALPLLTPMSEVAGYMATQIGAEYLEKSKGDRKSTRLNSSHVAISYAVFCLKKKKNIQ